MKQGDTVRILEYPEDSINAYGRISDVTYVGTDRERFLVSNYNMPYQGTISDFFYAHELRVVK